MKLDYKDKSIARIENETVEDLSDLGFCLSIIIAAKKLLCFLRNAIDERDIRNWKSLRFEKLKGKRKNQCSVRINDQWRLIIKTQNNSNPKKIFIYGIEDYH